MTAPPAPPAADARVTPWRVLRAEWSKFFSLRSNPIAVIAALVAVIGLGSLTAGVASGDIVPESPMGPEIEQPDLSALLDHATIATSGVSLAILIIGTLGVLAMSGEFSSGMVRATFAAVPRRLPILWGKAVVLAAVTLGSMTPAVLVTFFVAGGILTDSGLTASLGDANVLRALLGNVGYLVGLALLGLSLGALLRSTAGGVATLFATFLVVPQLLTLVLPDRLVDAVYGYLPSAAAQSFITTDPRFAFGAMGQELLSPAAGAGVFAAWVVALLVAAAISLARRDA